MAARRKPAKKAATEAATEAASEAAQAAEAAVEAANEAAKAAKAAKAAPKKAAKAAPKKAAKAAPKKAAKASEKQETPKKKASPKKKSTPRKPRGKSQATGLASRRGDIPYSHRAKGEGNFRVSTSLSGRVLGKGNPQDFHKSQQEFDPVYQEELVKSKWAKGKADPGFPKAYGKGARITSQTAVTRWTEGGKHMQAKNTKLYYRKNPMGDIGAMTTFLLFGTVGAIGSDILDRFVATLPSEGGSAKSGTTAAAAIAQKPDAKRLGAQGGLVALLGGLAYVLNKKNKRTAAYAVSALALGAAIRTLLHTFNLYAAPEILPASSDATKPSIGDRLYAGEQKAAQNSLAGLLESNSRKLTSYARRTLSGARIGDARQPLRTLPSLPVSLDVQRALARGPAETVAFAPIQSTADGAFSRLGCGGGGCGGCGGGCGKTPILTPPPRPPVQQLPPVQLPPEPPRQSPPVEIGPPKQVYPKLPPPPPPSEEENTPERKAPDNAFWLPNGGMTVVDRPTIYRYTPQPINIPKPDQPVVQVTGPRAELTDGRPDTYSVIHGVNYPLGGYLRKSAKQNVKKTLGFRGNFGNLEQQGRERKHHGAREREI